MQSYQFNVRADITGIFISYATVLVTVLNVNDNCPSFAIASSNIVYNGSPGPGSIVSIVKATDVDGSSLNYSIISGNEDGLFTIDNEAVVTFTKTIPIFKKFVLEIQSDDGVCVASTRLHVDVTTCSDLAEYQFEETNYVYHVREDRITGIIGTVVVRSRQSVQFSINTTSPFEIKNSGMYFFM